MAKKAKAAQLVIRIDSHERKALEKEPDALGLDLSAYLRHLLHTHPKREEHRKK